MRTASPIAGGAPIDIAITNSCGLRADLSVRRSTTRTTSARLHRHEAAGARRLGGGPRYIPAVSLGDVVAILISGLVIGALARLAVPGPDPMPIWLTILLGIVGSIVGGVVAVGIGFGVGGIFVLSVFAATLLVIAYRRIVQKRGITGPDAKRMP
jgi:uncharacterized membrane protein YeaQ/YmgE (transglycosylase-associated protein family)